MRVGAPDAEGTDPSPARSAVCIPFAELGVDIKRTLKEINLGVWLRKMQAGGYHFMFQSQYPPAPDAARAIADQLIGHDTMEKALADPRLDDLLRTSVNMFYSPAMQEKVLPILISPEKAVYGIPNEAELTNMFAHH